MRRINFAADRVSDLELPGVQSIIRRVRDQGTISPDRLVNSCLDLIGPIEVGEGTGQELESLADAGGELRWDTEEDVNTSARRVGEVLAMIAASREYQFT